MDLETKNRCLDLLRTLLTSPIFGIAVSYSLYEILDALGIQHKKEGRMKCWIYISLIVFALGVLFQSSAS